MKIGIFIDGLGQSVTQQSVIDYATRLKNEIDLNTFGVTHEIKVAKIDYTSERQTTAVTIIAKQGDQETALYKFYDFRYHEILTKSFSRKNALVKSFLLFTVVLKKAFVLFARIFQTKNFNRPGQIFYIFFLFFVISGAILFMVPATLTLISNFLFTGDVTTLVHAHPRLLNTAHHLGINRANFKYFSQIFVSSISILLLLAPNASTIITSLATEFVCAHYYLKYGQEKQDILGNIDRLLEYIVENEDKAAIHFHSYSFGTVVALDYLFPFGTIPSANMLTRTKALITIGSPFDFIESYYPKYYKGRKLDLESKKVIWLNVYSEADTIASNFRKKIEFGTAQYGVSKNGLKPININYEVVRINENSLSDFIMLNGLRAHASYWSHDVNGQSCVKDIFAKMKTDRLI